MNERSYIDYLNDIIDSINKIYKFIEDVDLENLENDEKTLFAVIRALEIIGEAVKKIPETIKDDLPYLLEIINTVCLKGVNDESILQTTAHSPE